MRILRPILRPVLTKNEIACQDRLGTNTRKELKVERKRWRFLYAGEMGLVTSQRSNELSFLHVHDGGLIGLDYACAHGESCRWFPCLPALPAWLSGLPALPALLACLGACVQCWPDVDFMLLLTHADSC